MKNIYSLVIEKEENGTIVYEIGRRGGHYGATRKNIMAWLNIPEDMAELLPNMIGAYCNYLGGGLRGAIVRSDYNEELPAKIAKKIDAFTEACAKRYLKIEEDWAKDEESYTDEWNEAGTKACRDAGIVSSY